MKCKRIRNWTDKYYSAEARAQIGALRQKWTPELQEQCSQEWSVLIADGEAALGEDPKSERVQALAKRWRKLVEGFTGGSTEVVNGLRKLYADQSNWPSDFKQHMHPLMNPAVWELMRQAEWWKA